MSVAVGSDMGLGEGGEGGRDGCEDVGSSRGRFSNIGSKKAVAVGRGFFSQPG